MSVTTVVVLDATAARALTGRIQSAVSDVWRLLEEAHDGRAWAALGYGTWADYVAGEFAMGKSHSYRLLDQAHVIRELEAAAGESPIGDINEYQARALKPRLADVRERVAAEPERVEEILADAVAEVQARRGRAPDGHRLTAEELPPPIVNENPNAGGTETCPRCQGAGKVRVW